MEYKLSVDLEKHELNKSNLIYEHLNDKPVVSIEEFEDNTTTLQQNYSKLL